MIRKIILIIFVSVFCNINAQDNSELRKMYEEDQNARKVEKIDWDQLTVEDSIRRAKVTGMINQNLLSTSNDFLHAAMIFQHGNDSTYFKIARDLSKRAVEIDSTNKLARWLIAAAQDRYLLSTGKPQWYGTQNLILGNKWYLRKIDTTKVTDTERIYYGVETLNKIKENIIKMNGKDIGFMIEPDSLDIRIR